MRSIPWGKFSSFRPLKLGGVIRFGISLLVVLSFFLLGEGSRSIFATPSSAILNAATNSYSTSFILAQEKIAQLELNKATEQEIAPGQAQVYSVSLSVGQVLQVKIRQLNIDVILTLGGPDGKQIVGGNLTGIEEQESFSCQATIPGSYLLTIRANPNSLFQGAYRLFAQVKPIATGQDKQRIIAEQLMARAEESRAQRSLTTQQMLENHQQALAIWRELNDPYWLAYSLFFTGKVYYDLGRYEQTIALLDEALVKFRNSNESASEGRVLEDLGASHQLLSRYERAIELYNQSLIIRRKIKGNYSRA
jgi:tetratricopeptide (TPR) repeat protein